ncbi:hypothetical protein CEXT_810081 [Caerostris extrusa]|uniref:Uncharacterized protein n=1 Tax=Caerostris extrusa TaxID=172846 RepID=A0AAV4U1E3_CAEEX|nr:hypothetical protein CEXT_810081 [Caerostris extrusa]
MKSLFQNIGTSGQKREWRESERLPNDPDPTENSSHKNHMLLTSAARERLSEGGKKGGRIPKKGKQRRIRNLLLIIPLEFQSHSPKLMECHSLITN